MKKFIFFVLILGMHIVTANAQLKVNSAGEVIIADTTSAPVAKLTVGPKQSLTGTVGISSTANGSITYNTGIYGFATYTPGSISYPNARNYGVRGVAGGHVTNYGVYGLLSASSNGAGVFGTVTNSSPSITKRYAGYFDGDLHVTKAITGGLANPYDLKTSNLQAITSALDNLNTISAKRYSTLPPGPLKQEQNDEDEQEFEAPGNNRDQTYHYMLQLSTVASAFPVIVKANGQGTQYVDYVELIPILVKAIQELSAQVDDLSEQLSGESMSMSPSRSESAATNAVKDASKGRACLYQNTPNPFTAQTEIRFSLPDDAPASYIYIFDMTGKMQKQVPVAPSMQSVTINGYELQPGIYLYSLVVGGQEIDTKRMILSK